MPFKFENLDVWKLSVVYIDLIYTIADELPRSEEFNLKAQMKRAAISIALNIAEGSTGQTDAEQARFLGMAIRSLIETVACQQIIRRRNLVSSPQFLDEAYSQAEELSKKPHNFRKVVSPQQNWLREQVTDYQVEDKANQLD
jgi:four helix bundle protein